MKHCLIASLALVAIWCCHPLQAQAKPRGETQIVHQVLAELSFWRNIPSRVHIEELPVSDQAGKLIEQDVDVLNEDLDTSQLVSNRILTHPRLSDQILLMGLLGSIESDIKELQGNLMDFAPTAFQNAEYQGWSKRANTAVKQTNSLGIKQMNYVTARADQMERSGCK